MHAALQAYGYYGDVAVTKEDVRVWLPSPTFMQPR